MAARPSGVYRLWFTYADPIIALGGACTDFFAPDTIMSSLVPGAVHDPQTRFLFHQLGGGMLYISFLSATLLRYTTDLAVWKLVQAGILIVDVVMLFSIWDAWKYQARLSPGQMRGEDWGSVATTAFVTVLRLLFLLEIGFKKTRGAFAKRA